MRCFRTARSIRTSCCVTVMEVSGLEPTSGGLSIYITAGQTYLRNPTDSQATSAAVSSRIVKAMFGSPATRGLDRFRELPVTTISAKQGLSSDYTSSLVAGHRWKHLGRDSRWFDQVEEWTNHNLPQGEWTAGRFCPVSVQDNRGRVWASFSGHGLSYFKDGRFVRVAGVPSEEVYSIAGDDKDNLWLSGDKGLSHLPEWTFGRKFPLVEPWGVTNKLRL